MDWDRKGWERFSSLAGGKPKLARWAFVRSAYNGCYALSGL